MLFYQFCKEQAEIKRLKRREKARMKCGAGKKRSVAKSMVAPNHHRPERLKRTRPQSAAAAACEDRKGPKTAGVDGEPAQPPPLTVMSLNRPLCHMCVAVARARSPSLIGIIQLVADFR